MTDPARSIAAVYERYHQSLYRFCFSIVGNAEDAQEALQNAMLKAIRALPGEQREVQLKPWLYRIAHNESIEILRKRRDEAQIDPELVASATGPDEAAATRERLRRLLSDISELPERQRGALVMRELGGLGFGEIGEALGTSEAVARQTVYEARLGLHQLEAGREMSCESVMRQISDADGRTLRRRDIRAHLRACPECRQFRDAIDGRSRDFAAVAPLPAAASAAILHAVMGGAGGHAAAGAGTASTIGAGAGKAMVSSAVLKSAATVAVVAALGVGAADRGGVIDVGLPGGSDSGSVSAGETPSGSADTAPSEAAPTTVGNGGTTTAPGIADGRGASASAPGKTGKDGSKAASGTTGTQGPDAVTTPGHGPKAGLPSASEHGQQTAAAHKATPHAASAHGQGHGSGAGQTGGGHRNSRSHAAHQAHHAVHSHHVNAHSHSGSSPAPSGGGGSQGGSQPQQPPPAPTKAPAQQSPTVTSPEARSGAESTESSP